MAEDAPYADELFPEKKPGGKPFADELFPASVDADRARQNLGTSPVQDYIFSRDHVSVARVLDHFGQGFKDAWGAEPLGLSEDSQKYLRSSGWFNDYQSGQASIAKAANEALFRPAAVALDAGWRAMGGVFRGAQEAVAATGEDLGHPQLGRDLAAIPEAFQGTPHPMGTPKVAVAVPVSEQLLLRARAAKVIGAGEDGWRGTAPETAPKTALERPAVTQAAPPVELPAEGQSAIEKTFANAPTDSPAPLADVHTVARGIAPDLFYKYDEVQSQRQTLSANLAELNDMRATTAAQAEEIAGLKAKVAARLTETETQSREMAPAVKEAYAEAQKTAPDEPAASVLSDEPAVAEAAPPAKAESAKPVEEQRATIAKDVADKLVAAGRSEPEAQAAAAIDAAYWITRAERFKGAKGTAEELYRREAPEILGPGMRSDYAKPREKPKHVNISLTQFIAQRGGIKDNDPLIGDVRSIIGKKNKLVPGFGSVIRKDGMTLDRLREAAVEAGYLSEDGGQKTTVRTLLDALRDEDKGRKSLATGDQAAASFDRDSHLHAIHQEIEHGLKEVGIDPATISEEVRARTAEIMDKEHVTDPVEAYERAESETGMFQRDVLPMDQASRLARANEMGFDTSKVWYHGASRSDRLTEKGKIVQKRATSGPMPYFTDDPEIASSYTTKKADTSLEEPSDYAGWFKFKPKGMRSTVDIDRSWHFLDQDTRAKISERAYDIKADDEGNITYKPGQGFPAGGKQQWFDYYLPREGGGNPLKTLKEVWLNSGILFNDEIQFMKVLKLAGMENVEFDHPYRQEPGVLPAYIKSRNPLDTAKVDDLKALIPELDKLASRSRRQAKPGADMWAKESHTVREFADRLKTDIADGTTYAWTSIPDEVTAFLKSKGYDSILDRGGKQGGPGHNVLIPFEPNQVRSVHAKFDLAKVNSDKLLDQDAGVKRGRIRLREDGRNTITLLKDANASTFIHEKGHDYLARMMKDADDPQAPVDLKTDAETVFKWLGVDKASDIKTSHHEKFARGFENYVMEGRAPSHALARVFEQFRQWLVRIYTEAARLKAPINDDIRAVFDRMLAVNPEKTVIAPERASDALAARHEGLADLTPPPVAADAAGTVRAERDTLAAQLPPEKQDARLAEIAAGLEGRAPGSAELNRDGNGPVAAPEGLGTGAESGTLGKGGGEASPQTSGVGEAKPAGPSVKTQPPAGAHSTFDTSNDLVDKAGNIRLDLLNAPDDVKNVISQVADENGQFQSVRGPVTDIQVAELADAMGMDATYLSTRKLGEAWTAPQIVALRNLLIQSATNVRDLMKKAAQGNEADLLAYAEAKTRHLMIQERVSSVTAEAGRALRAFQKRFTEGLGEAQAVGDFLKDATGKTLFQLEREVQLGMSLETPSQVSKFIHDSRKATASEMVQETWINALLSGPVTHVKNIIGNTAVAVLNVGEHAATAGVGKVREILGNDGERATLGEARANLFGLIQGAQDGLVSAKYAFMHEEQYTRAQTLEQGKFQAVPSKRIVLKTYEQGSPEYNARIDSFANARARAEKLTGERLAARVEELKSNPTPDMVAEAAERAVEIGGKQVRLPGRLLTAEDELFKSIAYRQKLNELSYRQANNEGLSGDAFNARMAHLTMNPSEEMMVAASKHADYQTFTNTLGKTGIALQQFSNSHILAKLVVPFIRTPLNLLKYANERTPLGVFSREVRANLSGTNGKIAQDTQIARIAIGTSLGATAMYLADQGYITGGGPSDRNEKAALMLSGWRPYSIKVGDTYYSYGWLDPFSTIMGISADMADAAKRGLGDDEELSKVATNLFASISKNILSKSSLRGASDLLNAVTDPDRWGAKYLQSLAGTVVPSVVAQQARAHDEYQREARTVVDNIMSRVPGLRSTLMPKRDVWGEPMPIGENLGPDTFSPINASKLTHDPATQALLDAEFFPAKITRKIRGVDLTDQQYDDFSRIAGRMAKMRVNAIVSNPGFANAPAEIRSELLKNTIKASRDAARSIVMMQNPGIIKQALDDKLASVGR